jgi:maltooligosyltrehalose trehalohydrolase
MKERALGPEAALPEPARGSWRRRLPVGAEVQPGGGVHFRVWAPRCRQVEVLCERLAKEEGGPQLLVPLTPEADGYYAGFVPQAGPGTWYRYRLEGNGLFPDPASRYQPQGPHGPSEVVDPDAFVWHDAHWPGVSRRGQVLYELHIGTFTPEGTWEAACRHLAELADLGVTVIEIMPVAEFPGRFGWGYDGVALFAPYHGYGSPEDFRRFVDRAHALGLGVILDVVYNHLGPDGCYLGQFAEAYYHPQHRTEWGDTFNFDGPDSGPVREFILANAAYWITEYHLDGLRLDATHSIQDTSPEHILAAVARRVRQAAGRRATFLVAENDRRDTRLLRSSAEGGCGLDALWNDDFHHAALVAATGRREAYLTAYRGHAQEILSCARWGVLYQGQYHCWRRRRWGTPAGRLPPEALIHYLENHDQLANTRAGRRLHTLLSPGRLRALTAWLLLGPQTPLLFQGQEFAASAAFHYFADHHPDLASAVAQGRRQLFQQFPSLATPAMQARLPDPAAEKTFQSCKLDFSERQRPGHAELYALHRDLLHLRRRDPVLSGRQQRQIEGAVLSDQAVLLRYLTEDGQDRLLLFNWGADLALEALAEPLLAPPPEKRWQLLWSSEDPSYGGRGMPPLEDDGPHHLLAETTLLLVPCSSAP